LVVRRHGLHVLRPRSKAGISHITKEIRLRIVVALIVTIAMVVLVLSFLSVW
jgi:hypothetical protein